MSVDAPVHSRALSTIHRHCRLSVCRRTSPSRLPVLVVPREMMCGSLEYGIRNFVFYQPECHSSNVMEIPESWPPKPQDSNYIFFGLPPTTQKARIYTVTLTLYPIMDVANTLIPSEKFKTASRCPLSMMSSHTLGRPNLVDPSLNPSLTSHPKLTCLLLPPAAAIVLFVMFAASASAASL
jgi:hypothetical protein